MSGSLAPKSTHLECPAPFTVTVGAVTLAGRPVDGYTTRWTLHWDGQALGKAYQRPDGRYWAELDAGARASGGSAVEAVERLCEALRTQRWTP